MTAGELKKLLENISDDVLIQVEAETPTGRRSLSVSAPYDVSTIDFGSGPRKTLTLQTPAYRSFP